MFLQQHGGIVSLISATFVFSVAHVISKLVVTQLPNGAGAAAIMLARGAIALLLSSAVLCYQGYRHGSFAAAMPCTTAFVPRSGPMIRGFSIRVGTLELYPVFGLFRGTANGIGWFLYYSALEVLPLPQGGMLYAISPFAAALATLIASRVAGQEVAAAISSLAVPGSTICLSLMFFAFGTIAAFLAQMNSSGFSLSSTSTAASNDMTNFSAKSTHEAVGKALFAGILSGCAIVAAKFIVSPIGVDTAMEEIEDVQDQIKKDIHVAHWVSVAWWPALGATIVGYYMLPGRNTEASEALSNFIFPNSSLISKASVAILLFSLTSFLGQALMALASSFPDVPPVTLGVLANSDQVFDFLLWQPIVFGNAPVPGWRMLAVVSLLCASGLLSIRRSLA